MERMADTKKRENMNDESGIVNGKKKVRRSTNDAIDCLKQKSIKDHDLKEKELDLRKRELELALDRQGQAAEQQQTKMKACRSRRTNNRVCKQCLSHSSNNKTKS